MFDSSLCSNKPARTDNTLFIGLNLRLGQKVVFIAIAVAKAIHLQNKVSPQGLFWPLVCRIAETSHLPKDLVLQAPQDPTPSNADFV